MYQIFLIGYKVEHIYIHIHKNPQINDSEVTRLVIQQSVLRLFVRSVCEGREEETHGSSSSPTLDNFTRHKICFFTPPLMPLPITCHPIYTFITFQLLLLPTIKKDK